MADEEAPIIRLVSQLLMEAMKNKASDIHLEPLEKSLRVRYRIPHSRVYPHRAFSETVCPGPAIEDWITHYGS